MVRIEHVCKAYHKDAAVVTAAGDICLELHPGDFAVVHGPSGSGKSTLLLMAGGMLPPDSGNLAFHGDDIYRWPPRKRNEYRKRAVGFIFQRFHLLPYLSVADNIRVALALQGRGHEEGLIEDVAQRLKIADRLHHRPAELSVGEQQRVAAARAIVGERQIILADEPTGNLDEENVRIVGEVLSGESEGGRIVALVTHNASLRDLGNRRFHLCEGRLTEEPAP
ncbi:MAG: ABC transporter ATP-binding protein [Armatimonadota bacterium]|jgi:putative ABC transport system ATP-binding protein